MVRILGVARELIAAGRPFILATVDQEGKPQARWMGGNVLDEPLTVWMACGANSRKVEQVRAHPAAQLLYSDEKFARIVSISGSCEVVTDSEPKRRLWEALPVLATFLSGPEDPNLGVLKFTGHRVELLDMAERAMTPQVAEV